MTIYKHYVDNVSGATGNGGTGPDAAHYTIRQAFDGISAGAYSSIDLAVIYVKDTGITYEENNNEDGFMPSMTYRILGTNSSFVQDGSRPTISNTTDWFLGDEIWNSRIYIENFNFTPSHDQGVIKLQNYVSFINCNFDGSGGSNYVININDPDGSFRPSTLGYFVNCYFQNLTSVYLAGSNRSIGSFINCYFDGVKPSQNGRGSLFVNCILDSTSVEKNHYGGNRYINTLLYNTPVGLGDRTNSSSEHLFVNSAFIDSPNYAINSSSEYESETYLFANNIFDSNVSGNFSFSNSFDSSLYYGITSSSGDPTFVDEVAGGTVGFVPTSTSSMSNRGIWGVDIGPLKSIFTSVETGTFSLGTGGVGNIVTVSGKSFQLVQDNPRAWRRV